MQSSGIIINTCGWVKGIGYKCLLHAIEVFNVDVIFVLDQERLYNELLRDVASKSKVVLLPKSGGVVEISTPQRIESRNNRIREYFYGARTPLNPHSFDVKWSDMKLYKIGERSMSSSGFHIVERRGHHLTKLVKVTPSPAILHHLISISFAEFTEDDVIKTNIMGIICVTSVNTEKQMVTVLSLLPPPLPSNNILLLSDIKFTDKCWMLIKDYFFYEWFLSVSRLFSDNTNPFTVKECNLLIKCFVYFMWKYEMIKIEDHPFCRRPFL